MSERFKNRKQAYDWLRAQGYKVSRGKFYADCAGGFPVVHADGTVSRYQVLEYAHQVEAPALADATRLDRAVERERLEIEKLRLDVERRTLEARREDRNWLRRDDAWSAVAGLLITLRDALHHHFHAQADALVHLAGGDAARAPQVFDAAMDVVALAYNELAGARIEGVFADLEPEPPGDMDDGK